MFHFTKRGCNTVPLFRFISFAPPKAKKAKVGFRLRMEMRKLILPGKIQLPHWANSLGRRGRGLWEETGFREGLCHPLSNHSSQELGGVGN